MTWRAKRDKRINFSQIEFRTGYENSRLGSSIPNLLIFLSCTTVIGNNASLIANVDVEITIHLQSSTWLSQFSITTAPTTEISQAKKSSANNKRYSIGNLKIKSILKTDKGYIQ